MTSSAIRPDVEGECREMLDGGSRLRLTVFQEPLREITSRRYALFYAGRF